MPSLRDLALSSSSLKARSVILLVLWILLKGWCTVKSLVNILNFCLILHLFNPCCYRTTGTLKKNMMISLKILCTGALGSQICHIFETCKYEIDDHLYKYVEYYYPKSSKPPPNSHKGCKVQYNKLKIFSQDQFDIN